MAIKLPVKQPNGVVLSYHRIALISIDINNQITILVHSYIDEAARQYEKDWAAGKIEGEPQFPYVATEYIWQGYIEGALLLIGDITKNVYKWLKSKSKYEGAEDV